jgi:large subunit ribosomal protein L30
MTVSKQIKITLVHSLIGRPEHQRKILKSLGLGKINSTAIQNDTPDIRGKVDKLAHVLKVEEIEA